MKLKSILFFVSLLLFLSSCRDIYMCETDCFLVDRNPNLEDFSSGIDEFRELENYEDFDCYFGSLNEKRPNTPNTWMHMNEGKRNAMWCSPHHISLEECDCHKYKNN